MTDNPKDKNQKAVQPLPSNRSFGFVFTLVFALVAAYPMTKGQQPWWSLAIIAAIFLITALASPGLLTPLNRLWTKFGAMLHLIMSPLVLGFIFFVVITPIGLLMRLLGKRPLSLEYEKSKESYWVLRDSNPDSGDMNQQF